MLRSASHCIRRADQHDQVSLLCGDLEILPYKDGSLNKLWSIHTFDFWADREAVFAELLRVLAREGIIVVTLAIGVVSTTADEHYWPLYQ